MSFYDLEAMTARGEALSFSSLRGRPVLVTNVRLHEEMGPQGLAILTFPCNQFGREEPGDGASVAKFAEARFGAAFTMMAKVDVQGPKASPVFKFLAGETANEPITWNFGIYYVISKAGVVTAFPNVSPAALSESLRREL
ncbi:thioredoxin-like protein [Pelagophyceae sp. CCMP2097]|nr:thioredoxin-like protein [Pelagophyceae sp. CCMP2097]